MIRTALPVIAVGLLAFTACSKTEKKEDATVSAAKAAEDQPADEEKAADKPSSADDEGASDDSEEGADEESGDEAEE